MGQLKKKSGIEGLGKTHVDHSCIHAFSSKDFSGLFRDRDHRSICQENHVASFQNKLGLSNWQDLEPRIQRNAKGFPSRVPERNGAGMVKGGPEQFPQFVLVLRSHECYVRNMPEIGDIENTMMGGTVLPHEAAAIHGEDNGKILKTDVMNDLVIGPLEKCRIDGNDRTGPLGCHSACECHGMLLGDPDIDKSFRIELSEVRKPCPLGHGRRNRKKLRNLTGNLDHGLAKNLRIGRISSSLLPEGTGFRIKGRNTVEGDGTLFGWGIALSLDSPDVEKNSPGTFLQCTDRIDQQGEIVSVNRSDIGEAHFLEPEAWRRNHADNLAMGHLCKPCHRITDDRDVPQKSFRFPPHLFDGRVGRNSRQIGREGPDILGNGKIVVIEDDQELFLSCSGLIQCLHRHPGRQGSIPDHRNDMVILAQKIPGFRHSKRRRNRGSRMARGESIVDAFLTLGKAAQAVPLANGRKSRQASCQHLVGVGLMPDIPDNTVAGSIKDPVKRERQFDHTHSATKMSADP